MLSGAQEVLIRKEAINLRVSQQRDENKNTFPWDFPGCPVVKNPPYKAGDAGLIPGQGTKIPHAAGQLSPCATTTELTHLN